MKRTLLLASLLLFGCQLPPERLPRQLPDDTPPMDYAKLLTRARAQASVATEAFYVDKWAELEDAALGLQQTARFLLKAEDVPPTLKDRLPQLSVELRREADKLREASLMKNVKDTTEFLNQINRTVRDMRLAP